jgi:hypothetical protein
VGDYDHCKKYIHSFIFWEISNPRRGKRKHAVNSGNYAHSATPKGSAFTSQDLNPMPLIHKAANRNFIRTFGKYLLSHKYNIVRGEISKFFFSLSSPY